MTAIEKEYVILVNENDHDVGSMEKLEAHKRALLHRAISVFLVNSNGDWILQQRSPEKYHSGGLWTNACCTHPFPGESNIEAANRRLMHEMGMHCDLKEIFHFTYREKLDNDLTEHEFDHVFLGICNDEPILNVEEVYAGKKISFKNLQVDIIKNPSQYTVWFKKIYKKVNEYVDNQKTNQLPPKI